MTINKKTTVSFFLSKINVETFSRSIKKHKLLLGVLFKFFAQRLIDLEFPTHIFLETTNACNLKCVMCPRNLKPVEIGVMDSQLFKRAIDEAGNHGPRSFSLHLFGEPLLDPGLAVKINYIKKKNPKNSILLTTNGTLLRNDLAKEIIKNEVDKVFISIHSAEEKTYQKITGLDFLKTVEENIVNLINLKKKLGSSKPLIVLRMTIGEINAGDIENFKNKWKKLPVILETRWTHNYGGKIADNPLRPKEKVRYPCYHLWLSPAVHWDGKMSICCNDSMKEAVIGDIKEKTITEIWNSDTLVKYRKYHLKGEYEKIPLCQNCDVWTSYPDIFFKWQKK